MKILDYSDTSASPSYARKQRPVYELAAATLIFIFPVIVLFILAN